MLPAIAPSQAAGRLDFSDESPNKTPAKCAETNPGLPNLHRFLIEFPINMAAG